MNEGEQLLGAGLLLAAGLSASLLAGRLRVPGLLLVLGVGMALGSDVLGLIAFDDYELARTIGVIALALILFEGGLTAGLPAIRAVMGPALSLALLGTLATAVVTGFAAHLLFDISMLEGMLLGAILSSTDGAAVFGVLRGSRLPKRVMHTLEGEAGNDRLYGGDHNDTLRGGIGNDYLHAGRGINLLDGGGVAVEKGERAPQRVTRLHQQPRFLEALGDTQTLGSRIQGTLIFGAEEMELM